MSRSGKSPSAPGLSNTAWSHDDLFEFYRTMMLIRQAEERIGDLFADGEIPGFVHLSIGQEAVAVGVSAALRSGDTVASNHRGHGHSIAKGLPLDGFFAELFGKQTGLCKGRGGSMHVADASNGMLGANGIVGAGLSIALGSALAHQTLGRQALAVTYLGDGALAEGLLHETLNIAALWSLPLLIVCENNGWSEFSPSSEQLRFDLGDFAAVYGVRYECVDGNDVCAVADRTRQLVDRLRDGRGPAVLECRTLRVKGHFEGDAQKYRDPAEIEGAAARDPIRRVAAMLGDDAGVLAGLSEIQREVSAVIDAAVAAARAAPVAQVAGAIDDVYTAGAL